MSSPQTVPLKKRKREERKEKAVVEDNAPTTKAVTASGPPRGREHGPKERRKQQSTADEVAETAPVSKEKKKAKKQHTQKTQPQAGLNGRATAAAPELPEKEPTEPRIGGGGAGQEKTSRFIVFIGNLPFTATKSSVSAHFSATDPASVRLMTTKGSAPRCRGFAFLEFGTYDKMELCLTKFHHSLFEGRKINVELTAGGGGNKSEARREKLAVKNRKLDEERQRVASDRQKDKAVRRVQTEDEKNGIHPSRRHRIQ